MIREPYYYNSAKVLGNAIAKASPSGKPLVEVRGVKFNGVPSLEFAFKTSALKSDVIEAHLEQGGHFVHHDAISLEFQHHRDEFNEVLKEIHKDVLERDPKLFRKFLSGEPATRIFDPGWESQLKQFKLHLYLPTEVVESALPEEEKVSHIEFNIEGIFHPHTIGRYHSLVSKKGGASVGVLVPFGKTSDMQEWLSLVLKHAGVDVNLRVPEPFTRFKWTNVKKGKT